MCDITPACHHFFKALLQTCHRLPTISCIVSTCVCFQLSFWGWRFGPNLFVVNNSLIITLSRSVLVMAWLILCHDSKPPPVVWGEGMITTTRMMTMKRSRRRKMTMKMWQTINIKSLALVQRNACPLTMCFFLISSVVSVKCHVFKNVS